METFEINTKNRFLKILHKTLLVTGAVTLVYLIIKFFEDYSKDNSTFNYKK